MARMAPMMVLCMVLVVVAPYAEAAITCGQVRRSVAPCVPYLANGGAVAPVCCGGVKALNSAAQTTPDRQTACNCLKSVYRSLLLNNAANAAALPGKCGVSFPYKISLDTDCTKVH